MAEVVAAPPRIPTAAGAAAIPAMPETPPVMGAESTAAAATPMAPAATSQATLPFALMVITAAPSFPVITIVSSSSLRAFPSSFSFVTVAATAPPLSHFQNARPKS